MLERQHASAASKIQAAFRSYLVRQRVKREVRSDFDTVMKTSVQKHSQANMDQIKILCSKLCLFFTRSEKQDIERLVSRIKSAN